MTPGLSFRVAQYELGQIAPVTVRAPYDFSYEDELTTEARREETAASVLEVYNFNDGATTDARNRIATAFELGRASLGEPQAKDEPPELLRPREELMAAIRDRLGVNVSDGELDLLIRERFSPETEQAFTRSVTNVLSRDIVASKERLLALGRPVRRREEISKRSQIRRDFSNVLSVEEAAELLEVQLSSLSDLRQADRRKLTDARRPDDRADAQLRLLRNGATKGSFARRGRSRLLPRAARKDHRARRRRDQRERASAARIPLDRDEAMGLRGRARCVAPRGSALDDAVVSAETVPARGGLAAAELRDGGGRDRAAPRHRPGRCSSSRGCSPSRW